MGQIRQQTEQIFPAKRLSLFLIIIRLLLKAQTFFPPKDLVYFFLLSAPFKSAIFSRQKT